jgi:hypothetical protein
MVSLIILIAYCWWAVTAGLKREVRDPGFVSTRDPVFGHAVHAPPQLYAIVIVMPRTGDHLDVVEKGRGGKSEVFSPYDGYLMIDGVVLKAQMIQVHPPKGLPKSARTLTKMLMIYGPSMERKLKVMTNSGLKS